jgi:hypothetical protein
VRPKANNTHSEKFKGLRELLYCLPEVNRDTLYAILALLHIIQVNRTINMMTSENLARYAACGKPQRSLSLSLT